MDRELVEHARARMSNLGVEMYTAEHDPRAGEPIHQKILAAIEHSTVVVVLLTSRGYESTYVQQEVGYAKAKKKLVIPIVTSQTKKLDLGMLQGLEYIEADETDPSAALDALDQRVAALVRQQQQAQTQTLLVVGAALILILLLAGSE
jgi:hypothetical protein